MQGAVVMRTLEGVARAGMWACLSDVDGLPSSSLSVLSQMMQIITSALQAKRDTITLTANNKVVCMDLGRRLKPWIAMFHM